MIDNPRASVGETFVEVHDEPMHRYRFQNPYIYLYDVLIGPGRTTLYHRHAEDTLYVSITDGLVTAQELGGERLTVEGRKGHCLCQAHRSHPLIHQIGNVGSNDIRLIGAEVRTSPPVTSEAPLVADGHTLIWETPRLRAYQVTLEPGMDVEATYGFSGLTVFLGDCCIETRDGSGQSVTTAHAPADWIWRDGPVQQRLKNVGTATMSAMLAEWR